MTNSGTPGTNNVVTDVGIVEPVDGNNPYVVAILANQAPCDDSRQPPDIIRKAIYDDFT